MSKNTQRAYRPNYALLPGDTLRETIEAYGMSQAELAGRTGRPQKTINEIVTGKASITAETALQFERVLGVSASFWNNLERGYQEALARIKEEQDLKEQVKWLKNFPIKQRVKLGEMDTERNRAPQTVASAPQLFCSRWCRRMEGDLGKATGCISKVSSFQEQSLRNRRMAAEG